MPFDKTGQDIWMSWLGAPIWVWIGAFIVFAHVVALAAAILWERISPQPVKRVYFGNNTIELWYRERRMPAAGEAIVVPVAPNLKMTFGIAKWVRDATADQAQREAERHAPLQPGQAVIVRGGKFKFGHTALAVVMDEQKMTSPALIAEGVARAIVLAREAGAGAIIVPDFTEDLLRQPQTISDEQRRATAAPIARAMISGILAEGDTMEVIKIWVWRKGYEEIYADELERVERVQTVGDAATVAHA